MELLTTETFGRLAGIVRLTRVKSNVSVYAA
jgi:xanthine/uracil permease